MYSLYDYTPYCNIATATWQHGEQKKNRLINIRVPRKNTIFADGNQKLQQYEKKNRIPRGAQYTVGR